MDRLDRMSAEALWEDAADAIDMAALSAVVTEDRTAQPLIPAIVAGLALKALVGVFCGGVFAGLGVGKLGQKVGERARGWIRRLRSGKASEIDEDEVTREVEGWVAEARKRQVTEEARARAEQAVSDLLVERGEDPERARASARALAQVIVGS